MARYFFDVMDGGICLDDVGVEFPDAQSACKEALHALPDLAKSFLPEKVSEEVVITMRDESGKALYRATLTIKTEWLGQQT